MHVTKKPSHGEVAIAVFDKATRIAYKPNPGFIGTDDFAVANDTYNIERAYKITVNQ